jgi:hypothetical protein
MADDLVTVERFLSWPEAEVARMQVEAAGIPVLLADAETVNMDWFMRNAIGYIKLQVPRDQAERAAAVLAQCKAERSESRQGAEDAEVSTCLRCGQRMPESAEACPACGWSCAGEAED